jgi:hypothetical protein
MVMMIYLKKKIAKELNDNNEQLEIVEQELLFSTCKGSSSLWRRRG